MRYTCVTAIYRSPPLLVCMQKETGEHA